MSNLEFRKSTVFFVIVMTSLFVACGGGKKNDPPPAAPLQDANGNVNADDQASLNALKSEILKARDNCAAAAPSFSRKIVPFMALAVVDPRVGPDKLQQLLPEILKNQIPQQAANPEAEDKRNGCLMALKNAWANYTTMKNGQYQKDASAKAWFCGQMKGIAEDIYTKVYQDPNQNEQVKQQLAQMQSLFLANPLLAQQIMGPSMNAIPQLLQQIDQNSNVPGSSQVLGEIKNYCMGG